MELVFVGAGVLVGSGTVEIGGRIGVADAQAVMSRLNTNTKLTNPGNRNLSLLLSLGFFSGDRIFTPAFDRTCFIEISAKSV